MLALLFRMMLVLGYNPSNLSKSTIVSIPKNNKGSLSRSDNYRGISLFNSICKVFDNVILYLYKTQLVASDMQFGYKESLSTTLCSLVYTEVVDHYLKKRE